MDSATLTYWQGLTCLTFAALQVYLFRQRSAAVFTWAQSQVLLGLGLICILYFSTESLLGVWITSCAMLIFSQLLKIKAIYQIQGLTIQKKPKWISIGVTMMVVALFFLGKNFGAPLGSLETIVIAPIAVSATYAAWFSTGFFKHKKLFSHLLWAEALILISLCLGALASLGDSYVDIDSVTVLVVSISLFVIHLALNIVWQDLIFMLGAPDLYSALNLTNSAVVNVNNSDKKALKNKSFFKENSGRSVKKIKTTDNSFNISKLTIDEKEQLLNQLTGKEGDVFRLAAIGKKNKEIATMLSLSEASVKVHKSRLTSKLGVKTADELAQFLTNKHPLDMVSAKQSKTAASTLEPHKVESNFTVPVFTKQSINPDSSNTEL